jgi:hypothetical protein
MNAQEARIKTEKSIIDKIEAKLNHAYNIIKKEAESGKYEVKIRDLILEPEQLEELRKQGYKAESFKIEHGYTNILFISWKE